MIGAVKTREKLIKKGRENGFSDLELSFFLDEALLAKQLVHIDRYIYKERFLGKKGELIVDEVQFVLSIYKKDKDFKILSEDKFIFVNLLPIYQADNLTRQRKRWIANIDYRCSKDWKNLTEVLVKLIKLNAHPKRISAIMKLVLSRQGYNPLYHIHFCDNWVKKRLLLPEDRLLTTFMEKGWCIWVSGLNEDLLSHAGMSDEIILDMIEPAILV